MATVVTRQTKSGAVRYDVRYRSPEGRQVMKTFSDTVRPGGKVLNDGLKKAEKFSRNIETDKDRDEYVDPRAGRVTFREYAEQWRENQAHHRAGTATSVEQHLRLHVYPVIGARQLKAITPSDVRALVKVLSASLEASTVAVVYGRVVAVFRAAVDDDRIRKSPCVRAIKLPRKSAAKLEILTTAQVVALAGAIAPRYRALVITAATTGLRPGELFGLTRDRLVDFLNPRAAAIKVDRQLVRVRREGVQLADLKTASSHRTVPMPQATKDALAAHLAEWPVAIDGLVFTNERGGPIQQHPYAMVFETARRKAGLPEWATPHDLRHYYASLLIQSGASVKTVQSRLGHASATTTLDTYSHLWPDEDDRTRAAVDAVFAHAGAGREAAGI